MPVPGSLVFISIGDLLCATSPLAPLQVDPKFNPIDLLYHHCVALFWRLFTSVAHYSSDSPPGVANTD
jgi:hypothetical protein